MIHSSAADIAKAVGGLLLGDFNLYIKGYSFDMFKRLISSKMNLDNNINKLEYSDEIFDKVVAGNVIHLLDKPENALSELMRVCKKGGMIIIPTYINLKQKFMQI